MGYKIPLYIPNLAGNEKKYVNECLDSTWISSKGKFIKEFEDKFSEFINVKYATAVSNGTTALHLALETLGITSGDEVIVPTFTYIASVSSIIYTGATPVFVDSVEETWQMDAEDIKKKITPKTKAIMVVHLYGQMCDMDAIMKIANDNNLFVIEDCAEAFGSQYKGKYAGTFGNISTFSFYGNKTITTGEGGMVVSNDYYLYDKAYHLKMHGVSTVREYWHDVIGYNYRMTNICAAIGLAQLERAEDILKKKRFIADTYNENLKELPVVTHKEAKDTVHSYWMYSIMTENVKTREALRKFLSDNGIETRPTFYPAHTMPMFTHTYQKFRVAEELAIRGINLPSFPELKKEQVLEVCDTIKKFYSA
ncbi:MAG: DegT/DnrJ/EryC1/StrS aminotransferase family protein [Ignavibacteriota bacterium]|nr:DegT/DnrJ/EryC1/StrS aminotransferase family protein [Ignavibacteriota bacterium]